MYFYVICQASRNFSLALEPLRSFRRLYTVLHLRGTAQPGGAGGFLAHWTVGGTLTKKMIIDIADKMTKHDKTKSMFNQKTSVKDLFHDVS